MLRLMNSSVGCAGGAVSRTEACREKNGKRLLLGVFGLGSAGGGFCGVPAGRRVSAEIGGSKGSIFGVVLDDCIRMGSDSLWDQSAGLSRSTLIFPNSF